MEVCFPIVAVRAGAAALPWRAVRGSGCFIVLFCPPQVWPHLPGPKNLSPLLCENQEGGKDAGKSAPLVFKDTAQKVHLSLLLTFCWPGLVKGHYQLQGKVGNVVFILGDYVPSAKPEFILL